MNKQITQSEVRSARESGNRIVVMHKEPNRRQRREAAEALRPMVTNCIPLLPNNRSHPVTRYHVFLKMAHFFLAIGGRRYGLTPAA